MLLLLGLATHYVSLDHCLEDDNTDMISKVPWWRSILQDTISQVVCIFNGYQGRREGGFQGFQETP